jgi:Zn-dependent peptidase ImmA (M78 family)
MLISEMIYSPTNASDVLVDFLRFACRNLGISSLPKIHFISSPVSNSQSNSFAAYSRNKEIFLFTKHRHIIDVLRSLCHELVHYRQDLTHQLQPSSGETGSTHENEANAVAGQIMRKYCKLHPELF